MIVTIVVTCVAGTIAIPLVEVAQRAIHVWCVVVFVVLRVEQHVQLIAPRHVPQAAKGPLRNKMKEYTKMENEGKTANIKEIDRGWRGGMAKNITFIVTKDCQLACKYCYLVGKNVKERMSWEVAKTFINYVLDNENDPDF